MDPESPFLVRTRRVDETVLVEVEGGLDLATTPHLRERLEAAVEDVGTQIFLDLSKVSFIDSTGWLAVCEAAAVLHGRGEALMIVGTSPPTRRLLGILGLDPGIEVVGAADPSYARRLSG